MPLMVALGARVRICGTQVQKPKPVIDVDLSETSVAGHAEVQSCLLPLEAYSAKLAERERIVLVEDMILAFEKVRGTIQLLERIRCEPDNQLKLMVAGLRAVFSLDVG